MLTQFALLLFCHSEGRRNVTFPYLCIMKRYVSSSLRMTNCVSMTKKQKGKKRQTALSSKILTSCSGTLPGRLSLHVPVNGAFDKIAVRDNDVVRIIAEL